MKNAYLKVLETYTCAKLSICHKSGYFSNWQVDGND
jgi:hypothetical protein